ncbi:MAG: UDP-2,4-diacetamido-2,4,6-trideoxy-beta-L-altropyranose hydrolase [Lachnospiraceae bacterium]|nr:UDP-2,4-diacetamido-2,4,6-trideoxy-beta-L-altropyranose hydrolase [Lachnospiraceae bacterium]
MKIAIRADGNKNIAIGHLRRCMTIAHELERRGAELLFILADEESGEIFQKLCEMEGTEAHSLLLGNAPDAGLKELPALLAAVKEQKVDLLLADSYAFGLDYYTELRRILPESVKLACIDDLHAFDPPVDLLINYDVNIPKDFYSAGTQLLGASYAPLRRQFSESGFVIREKARRFFLTSGGTDPYRVLGKILDSICSIYAEDPKADHFICDVVIGPLFDEAYKRELRAFAEKNNDIFLHENVSDMASLMKNCDVAVSAGGTTVFELCAIGVPSIVFSMADNQIDFAHAFHKAGGVWYIGDARKDPGLAGRIISQGRMAVYDTNMRREMSSRAHALVDGKGAERIAETILELIC